jgi:hypothetical protein
MGDFFDSIEEDIIIPTFPSTSAPKASPISFRAPAIISQEALNALCFHGINFAQHSTTPSQFPGPTQPDLIHLANPVVHPITGEHITSYEKLAKDPVTRDVWTTAFGKELGGLAQGDNKTGAAGTDTVFFMTHDEIQNIPKDRTVTYTRVVVDYRPQKEDPNRVRITVGGNLIDYPGELTTHTADLVTSKILWNSVVSTKDARYCTADLKLFYLTAPMDRYEYMRMPLRIIPEHVIDQYNLREKAKNGFVYNGNQACHVWPPTSRHLGQQITQKTPGQARILRG